MRPGAGSAKHRLPVNELPRTLTPSGTGIVIIDGAAQRVSSWQAAPASPVVRAPVSPEPASPPRRLGLLFVPLFLMLGFLLAKLIGG